MDDDRARPRAWLVVALLWMVACLNYLDRTMITTMRGSIVHEIPMTEAQFGLLTGAFAWVYGVLSPLAGFLADRLRRNWVIVGSLFVWSAITWLTAYARTFDQLLFARALMGVSEACYIPAALALIADYHPGKTRSLATGVHMSGVFAGAALGGLGGVIAERQHWNSPFIYFGIFGMLYALFLIAILREPVRASNSTRDPRLSTAKPSFLEALKSLFQNGSFLVALLYWSLLGVAGWAFIAWLPTFLKEDFALTQSKAGVLATASLQTASFFGVIAGGLWADRWSRRSVRGPILVPAVGLLIAVPGVLLTANATLISIVIAGLVIYGFNRAFADANMMPILCLIANPRYRATGYGILNLFSCLAGGLAIYVGGLLRDSNVNVSYVFQFAALALALCALLLFFLKPTQFVAAPPT